MPVPLALLLQDPTEWLLTLLGHLSWYLGRQLLAFSCLADLPYPEHPSPPPGHARLGPAVPSFGCPGFPGFCFCLHPSPPFFSNLGLCCGHSRPRRKCQQLPQDPACLQDDSYSLHFILLGPSVTAPQSSPCSSQGLGPASGLAGWAGQARRKPG
jgi:hypothetical protein